MDRAFSSGALGTPPSAPGSPSIGYATSGNPGTGTPPTKPGAYWYHMMTEELRAVLVAAGLTPSQTDLTQLLQALPSALASRPEMARSLTANGYQKLPGGLIIQWGIGSTGSGATALSFPIAFSSAVYSLVISNTPNSGNAISVASSVALSGFTVTAYQANTGVSYASNYNFIAIGK